MLPAQRRDELIRVLTTEGRVVAREVAERLGLSEDTVRRDLRDMAAAGVCQRVYGGALPVSPAVADYAVRQGVAVENKDRVARRAAALVRPGSTAILDGGTTALAVARALPPDLDATVVTHSPTVAAALAAHPTVEVLILGGRLFKHSVVASGALLAEAAAGVVADVFLLGVTGVHAEAGLTTGDADEAATKRALAARAGDTYVLASAEKVGAASPFRVLPLEDVTGIVTDVDLGEPAARALAEAGATLLPAP
ncbi:DeoR/GlpR family DNA-binding transcription regulator [Cellulomonas triticagri]|uniref:Lactose phosphotransferase system repressor n=1 Tax=Cellulomonas triticagri TaxID=2483352 RepID=A0A3M2JN26_9CELL|nr:DeoR/GlpR family DNA-binding transcription regulator [Cellulomonas triticagri]RMI13686.1 DeoR/GlpR transcriptional regulator [Cellulomonas triticagri]